MMLPMPESDGYSGQARRRHELYAADLEVYRVAVQWYTRQLVVMGYEPKACVLVPERNSWFFYDSGGEHIFTVGHAQMEHVLGMLRGVDGA